MTLARCLLLFALALIGSPAAGQDAAEAPQTYWIFLTEADRPAPDLSAVTPEALARRRARGGALTGAFDAPLHPAYLDALRSAGVVPRAQSRWLNAVSADLTFAQHQEVGSLPFVRDLRPVRRFQGQASRAQPAAPFPGLLLDDHYGPSRGQLARINAIAPLERGIDGRGVRLGFLDTEYGAFQHPVFAPLRAEGRLLADSNFVGQAQTNLHGLSVASVAVGYAPDQLVGPAHGAFVLAATTEYAPTETNKEEDDLVRALEWLERQGADVVNISLGYTTFDVGQRSYTPAELDGDTGVTTQAVDRAAALGVVVVTSAGNSGCGDPQSCWYYVGTPADADSVIAVGAVNADSTRAGFSSSGPTADGRIKPDVAAPGTGVVVATAGGYATSSGTSFSAPLVAGVVAQMLQVNPALAPTEVRTLLRQTASQADSPDNRLGWGIVDADAAVREAERLALGLPGLPERLRPVPYPNPADDGVSFDVAAPGDEPQGPIRLFLYDLVGRRVLEVEAPSTAVRLTADLAPLRPGVYLYRLVRGAEEWRGPLVVAR